MSSITNWWLSFSDAQMGCVDGRDTGDVGGHVGGTAGRVGGYAVGYVEGGGDAGHVGYEERVGKVGDE